MGRDTMAGPMDRRLVYTDGACSGNPGPGGWAWIVPDGPFASGHEPDTTNQRMELVAALEAIRALDGELLVVSDSTYVVNCFRDKWWEGWIARGWLNSQKKPVANRDLWEPLIEVVNARDVGFRWVKGHAGDEWNDLADRLAVEAAFSGTGRSGDTTPTEVAEPDRARAAPRADGRDPTGREPPDGHRLAVFGLRPRELGGYDENPTVASVRTQLEQIISAKQEMHDDLVVLSGVRLGAEMLAAEAARSAGVPYVAVLPYPAPDDVWPELSRRRFAGLIADATDVITLQGKSPSSKQQARAALGRRDAWLTRHAVEALVVWDHEDADVGRVVRSLVDALGEEDVWVIEPG